ncbi:MAG TPA: PAS domain S-box protein, partial [Gemmatimonadaceae bacterium]|nr:PAS domain S-box protein [Gemmatimonadaceae bacterium]
MNRDDLVDFLENALDAMHWVGPDGTILWANGAELEMLGYTRDEYFGQPITAFHCDAQVIQDILGRLGRNEKIRDYPARLRRKDGSIREVLITSSVLWRDGEFVHTRCITRDVTEQKRLLAEHQRMLGRMKVEHALTRLLSAARPFDEIAPELLRTLGEAADWSVGILWFVDGQARVLRAVDVWHRPDSDAAAFLDDTCQRAFRKGTGLPGRVWEAAHAIWIDDVVHAGNFPRAEAAERAGLHGAVGFPIRLRGEIAGVVEFLRPEMNAPNSEMLQLFEEAGYQIGHYIERRRSDEMRDRLAAIVDSSDDAIISKTLDGVITSWNRGAERMFGYNADEAVGQKVTLIIPKERHGEEDDVLSRIRRGIKVDHYETVRQAKDGRLVDVSLTVSPVRDSDGRIIGASKVARDVSSWKLAQQVLREREELAQAEVRVRDDFLSIAAHELRNPLNALQLQLVSMHRAALEAGDRLPAEWLAERLGQANDDVGTLVRLVHN